MQRPLLIHTQCWTLLCLSLMATAYTGCENPDSSTASEPRNKTTSDNTPPSAQQALKEALRKVDSELESKPKHIQAKLRALQNSLRVALIKDHEGYDPHSADFQGLLEKAIEFKYPLLVVQALIDGGAKANNGLLELALRNKADTKLTDFLAQKGAKADNNFLNELLSAPKDKAELLQRALRYGDVEDFEKEKDLSAIAVLWHHAEQAETAITKALLEQRANVYAPLAAVLEKLVELDDSDREEKKKALDRLDCLLDHQDWVLPDDTDPEYQEYVLTNTLVGEGLNVEKRKKILDKLLAHQFDSNQAVEVLLDELCCHRNSILADDLKTLMLHLLENNSVDIREWDETHPYPLSIRCVLDSKLAPGAQAALIKRLKGKGATMGNERFGSLLNYYATRKFNLEVFKALLEDAPPAVLLKERTVRNKSVLELLLGKGRVDAAVHFITEGITAAQAQAPFGEGQTQRSLVERAMRYKRHLPKDDWAKIEQAFAGIGVPQVAFAQAPNSSP